VADEVLILGAGVAGLAAACELARRGIPATILEARDRIGGRIYTRVDPACPLPIELGAEFIHGTPPQIFDLVQHHRLLACELAGDSICVRAGQIVKCGEWFNAAWRLLEALNEQGEDRSFQQFLDADSEHSSDAKARAADFVEGFNAADRRLISVHALAQQQRSEDETNGDRSFRLVDGYDSIPNALWRSIPSGRVRLQLGARISEIIWRPGEVRAGDFHARRAIITIPLGVLKSGGVRIKPEPPRIREALDAMEMGNAIRVVLRFRERFWDSRDELATMSFLHAPGETFRTWWSSAPLQAPLLTAWAGGPAADHLTTPHQDAALESLAHILKVERRWLEDQLEGVYVHDWRSDSLACGAYSYVRVNGLSAANALSEAVENTLYFAGEHACPPGLWGTVHGAIASGVRAAKSLPDVSC